MHQSSQSFKQNAHAALRDATLQRALHNVKVGFIDKRRIAAEKLPEFEYRPVLSRADAAWQGRRGYVQDAVVADIEDLSDYAIYLCGSPTMVSAAKALFVERGASLNHIYADTFLFQHNR